MPKPPVPRMKFPYGDKTDIVIPFDLFTIELVEKAADMGMEKLTQQFESENTRRMGTIGRVLHGVFTRHEPECLYETFLNNFDMTIAVPTFMEVVRCLQEASAQLFGGMAEVEEKKDIADVGTKTGPTTAISTAAGEATIV